MFFRRISYFFVSILLLFLIGCHDQSSTHHEPTLPPKLEYSLLKGIVTNERGEPIAQAGINPIPQFQVALPEIGKQTDNQGKFEWNLPVGKYQIQISKEGYQVSTSEINLTKKGMTLRIVLKEKK
ncbi:carboxypeptidase-like regulatory domain-containing protein [Thermoflavimicrobium daqui]|nr:carboxypeptidase-like regulatory domain-containing protein [Thermoflavimicrobium daqui]